MSPLVYLSGALALGCAALGLWVTSLNSTIAAKDATIKARDATILLKDQQIAQAAFTNAQSAAALAELRAVREAQSAIALEFDNQARARDAHLAQTLEAIARGPVSEDGPVALVIERQLERMRERSAAADRSDRDQGGAGGDPSGEAALQEREAEAAGETAHGNDAFVLRGGIYR